MSLDGSLHEDPMRSERLGDLALRVGRDVPKPTAAVQSVSGRHEVGTVEPDARVVGLASSCNQTVQNGFASAGPSVRWLNVHALDLRRIGLDPTQAADPKGVFVREHKEDTTAGRPKLLDR